MEWYGRSVLVTGADGFVGSHLVEELVRRNARVTAVVRRTSRSQVDARFRNLTTGTVANLQNLVHVDLASPSAPTVLGSMGCDVWFHLAADAFVPASLDQPTSVLHSNLMSTVNVLDAARVAEPEHLLVTSSSEIYGSQDHAITEAYALAPATPYAASKVACDRLAFSYHNSFQVPLTIVRPFNCYGPRHVYDVVPIFLRRALCGEDLIVNGTGEQSRDLTYVDDTVDAFVRLAQLPPTGTVYNVGAGLDHSVITLAHMVINLTGSSSRIRFGPERSGEVWKLQADSTKLSDATGWHPSTDLVSGLKRNISWMTNDLKRST